MRFNFKWKVNKGKRVKVGKYLILEPIKKRLKRSDENV
jgi:hypothetical protein